MSRVIDEDVWGELRACIDNDDVYRFQGILETYTLFNSKHFDASALLDTHGRYHLLHWAAMQDATEIGELLVNKGVALNISAPARINDTPLNLAILHESKNFIDFCLDGYGDRPSNYSQEMINEQIRYAVSMAVREFETAHRFLVEWKKRGAFYDAQIEKEQSIAVTISNPLELYALYIQKPGGETPHIQEKHNQMAQALIDLGIDPLRIFDYAQKAPDLPAIQRVFEQKALGDLAKGIMPSPATPRAIKPMPRRT